MPADTDPWVPPVSGVAEDDLFSSEEPTQILSDPLPGTPYVLLERLGVGGMGEVFRALHTKLQREVAIKLLTPQMGQDADAMERLRREARAAASIGSPHIIHIDEMGTSTDGRSFVVMELLPGHELAVVLQNEGPQPVEWVAAVVHQVSEALHAAHRASIIHRDLKPENIMLERRGGRLHATVLDFGIAHSNLDRGRRLTTHGQVMGTPGYLAPEQALDEPLDGRADQYSLGAIAYELLCGELPFTGESALKVIAAQLTKEPIPLSRRVDAHLVSPAIQAVVMRALSRDRSARFDDMRAFSAAFSAALRNPKMTSGPRLRHPWLLLAGLTAISAALTGLVLWAPWTTPPTVSPRTEAPVIKMGAEVGIRVWVSPPESRGQTPVPAGLSDALMALERPITRCLEAQTELRSKLSARVGFSVSVNGELSAIGGQGDTCLVECTQRALEANTPLPSASVPLRVTLPIRAER